MQRNVTLIVLTSLAVVGALSLLEQFEGLTYALKAIVKIVLLLALPIALAALALRLRFLRGAPVTVRSLLPGFMLGLIASAGVFLGYALFGHLVDFASVLGELETKLGIRAENFIYVALYVTVINSLLEELFFRGFIFLGLLPYSRVFAYLFSASLFAVYHVAIIGTWFSPVLMALALFSLFAVGIVFNWINERSGHFYNSWLAHAMADFAIVLIGFRLFGLL